MESHDTPRKGLERVEVVMGKKRMAYKRKVVVVEGPVAFSSCGTLLLRLLHGVEQDVAMPSDGVLFEVWVFLSFFLLPLLWVF